MLSFDELQVRMQELGYRWEDATPVSWGNPDLGFKIGFFFKRFESKRPCLTNDKDQFTVEVYDWSRVPDPAGRDLTEERYSFALDVTGEGLPGTWFKLSAYNVSPQTFLEKHAVLENALKQAWEALA